MSGDAGAPGEFRFGTTADGSAAALPELVGFVQCGIWQESEMKRKETHRCRRYEA